ncbi:MAG: HAMP domain-containing histidine kinase, partial [Lachnospiraceae bacterium]|nr:HAMP domain-containing histidine kinase [Lachnospiraceae bacterium]
MSGRKNLAVTFCFVLSAGFIASALAVLLMSCHYSKLQYDLLDAVCGEVLEQEPEAGQIISAALKEYTGQNADGTMERGVLSELGYRSSDFLNADYRWNALYVMTGFLAGVFFFAVASLCRNKAETARIQALAEYLEQVNMGEAVILSASGEDMFSKLEDEIYKTVTFLYQTKDVAVQTKNDFAENLSNIAHQIKTPITAISLSVQTMREEYNEKHLEQIQKQLLRLAHLEEALLILSRLDAGTLVLQEEEIDVFTVLVLAADNLQELLTEYNVSVDIPELGEMAITADLDWTMEAVINLMKNCMEHSAGGTIHCV